MSSTIVNIVEIDEYSYIFETPKGERYQLAKENENYEIGQTLEIDREWFDQLQQSSRNIENDENSLPGSITSSLSEIWSEAETLALIKVYEEHMEDFKHAKKRKTVWIVITEKLQSMGVCKSAEKIERKWLNLIKVYHSIKDNKGPRKIGRGANHYKYFELLDEILGDKPSNKSSETLEVFDNSEISGSGGTTSTEVESASELPGEPSTKKPRLNATQAFLKSKQEYFLQKQKRHTERMKIEQEKIEIEKRKIALLEKYLQG